LISLSLLFGWLFETDQHFECDDGGVVMTTITAILLDAKRSGDAVGVESKL